MPLHHSYTPCLLWVGLSLEFGLCRTITIDSTTQQICVGDGGAFFQVD